jgi:hypothetical protein
MNANIEPRQEAKFWQRKYQELMDALPSIKKEAGDLAVFLHEYRRGAQRRAETNRKTIAMDTEPGAAGR